MMDNVHVRLILDGDFSKVDVDV